MNKANNNNRNNNRFTVRMVINFIIISLVATVLINVALSALAKSPSEEIEYSYFLTLLDEGKIAEVTIQSDRVIIIPKDEAREGIEAYLRAEESKAQQKLLQDETGGAPAGSSLLSRAEQVIEQNISQAPVNLNKTYYAGLAPDREIVNRLEAKGVKFAAPVDNSNPIISILTVWVLPMVLMYGLFYLMMRKVGGRGGLMSIGQSNAKVYIEKKTGVTFDDVAGQEEAKESLQEIVDFLHHPAKYAAIGAKQPKGALLVGPPGTGKTLLAKAVAGEANVPFFSLSGSEFVEMFVGVGASRVRDLFKQADQHAPCIIFIDEIDAIGKSRDNQIGGNDEREQTLNQLLAEMDGFDSSKGVVILAATNRPEILDKALLRPGRFDRRIIVEKPDLKGRESILLVHAKKVKMEQSVDWRQIALATSGATGADLANMINEAALRAVRMERKLVTQEDLMEAVEVIVAGKEKKDRILTEKEKRIVAFHEVGHALAAALQKNTQPVQKITIVPRTMGALGYTMQMPEEERYLMTKQEILEQITVLLSGRAAEEVEFQLETTGAANDIERATAMARSMVAQYGMSKTFGMMGLESPQNKYLDNRNVSTCSEQTGADVDREVLGIIQSCHDNAMALLNENREALTKIAEYLYTRETITGEEFMNILKEYRYV